MGRIKDYYPHVDYYVMRSKLFKMNDDNFCAVLAAAIVCGVEVEEAHRWMQEEGRKEKQGLCAFEINRAISKQGYEVKQLMSFDIIKLYPARAKTLKSITTHHPDRFPKVWKGLGNCLLYTKGHVSALRDGELIDHARGQSKRVWSIYQVTKEGE